MHNQYVINNCPKDKLLVWKLEDGWEPVAKFLGKPVPKGPLPHKNRLGGVIQDLENSPDYQVENRSRQRNLSFCGVIWIFRKISEIFLNFSVKFGFSEFYEFFGRVWIRQKFWILVLGCFWPSFSRQCSESKQSRSSFDLPLSPRLVSAGSRDLFSHICKLKKRCP